MLFILLLLSSLSGRRKKGKGGEGEAEKSVKGKRSISFSPQTPPFFPFFPVPYPFVPLLLLGIDIIHDPQFDSSVGNKLSLYSELKNEVRFDSYLDLRWLDWIFFWGGGYLPRLSINYVGMSKDMAQMLPQLYYIMMKIYYDLGFIAIGVTMAT